MSFKANARGRVCNRCDSSPGDVQNPSFPICPSSPIHRVRGFSGKGNFNVKSASRLLHHEYTSRYNTSMSEYDRRSLVSRYQFSQQPFSLESTRKKELCQWHTIHPDFVSLSSTKLSMMITIYLLDLNISHLGLKNNIFSYGVIVWGVGGVIFVFGCRSFILTQAQSRSRVHTRYICQYVKPISAFPGQIQALLVWQGIPSR